MNLFVIIGAVALSIINFFNGFIGNIPVFAEEVQEIESVTAVPILMFHHFVFDDEDCVAGTMVTAEKFNEVLNYIEDNGYTTISFRELIDYTENKGVLPAKPILITMDDGYMSNYEIAYPLLKEKNMKALVSIIGMFTDKMSLGIVDEYLPHIGWEEVREMIDSEVFEIGNHTFDLHKLRHEGGERNGITKNFLESELDYARAVREDIDYLEEALEVECEYNNDVFCYPYGFYDDLSEAIISSLGYKVTLTTDEGMNYIKPGDSLIGLKRINVDMYTDLSKYLK